jgi:cytochrome c oxidase subunit 1
MQYEFLHALQPINVFITVCAFLLGLSQLLFVINFVRSLVAGERAERNPWQANTLEWAAPSPPPHGNWGEALPVVYGGPYEYSPPGISEDYLPQTHPRSPAMAAAH